MREKLISLLMLKTDATDEQIVQGVETVIRNEGLARERLDSLENSPAAQMEKRIAKKINESGGALNRETAAMVIQHQDEARANRKPAARK